VDSHALDCHLRAGKLAREALAFARAEIKEGMPAIDLARKVDDFISSRGGGFAFPVNVSFNVDAAHYTPRDGDGLVFKRGDLVKIDLGAEFDGYVSDTAATVEIGTTQWTKLIAAVDLAVERAVALARPGTKVSVISETIHDTISSSGFKPVENLTGHHLKQYSLHAGGNIPNIRGAGHGMLKEGDAVAIEPFATPGRGHVDSSRPGNIYRVLENSRDPGDPKLRKAVDALTETFHTLPFAERWCSDLMDNPPKTLSSLVRKRSIMSYPVLTEVSGQVVSQAEHSVIVSADGPIVFTRD
jgi:methionyl aminopeptidase